MPIKNINDQVFAAKNSAIKYGIALIFALLQKKQIKGVNVRITISFDVNTVKTLVKAYKAKKRAYWFDFALLVARWAKYLNNPNSSKRMEIIVIEKNKTMIFNGFIDVFDVNWFQTSLIGAYPCAINKIAPNKATMQYVDKVIFPILIFGKKRIERVTKTNVIKQIISVGIIHNVYYLLS